MWLFIAKCLFTILFFFAGLRVLLLISIKKRHRKERLLLDRAVFRYMIKDRQSID